MLINPSNLYSGGNVKLDSTPYTRIALQQQYRKQAMEEASNQYFSKLPDRLNPAGVRTQDLQNQNGGILNDLDGIKNYWLRNKDEIRKGGMAQQNYFQQIERAKQNIQLSKDRAQSQLLIGKEALKPNGWKPREEDSGILEAMDKPINDPASKKQDGVTEYGLNDLSLSAAPYNSEMQLKHDKAIGAGIVPDKLPNDEGSIDPTAAKVTYQYGYTPEKVDMAMNNAIQETKSNRTIRYHYEDLLKDPAIVERASKILQAQYDKTGGNGKQVVVDTPEEIAAALAIEKYSNYREPKTFTDVASIHAWQEKMQNNRFAQARSMANLNDKLIKGRKSADITDVNQVGFPTEAIADTFGENLDLQAQPGIPGGVNKVVYIDKIPTAMWRTINPTDFNKQVYPVEGFEMKQQDGSYRPFVIKTPAGLMGKGGKLIGNDDSRDLYIKEKAPTKFKMGLSSKGKITNSDVQAPPIAPKPKKAKFD